MSSAPRHTHEEGDHGSERWLVSYADFITLMFAFFAVLYATSQKDADKSRQFQESIKKYLVKAGAGFASPQAGVPGVKGTEPIESPIQQFNPSKPESVKTMDEAETFVEENLTKAERAKYVTDLTSDDWGVRLVIPNSALFSPGSEKFRPEALPFIDKLAALLAKTKRKVLVEGFVGQGEVGSYHSTWDFASARAVNILRYMQKKEGFSPDMLVSASMADSRPLFHEGDKKALNSRIEVVLLNEEFEF
jgi:chemotaxis protein MotB